MAQRKTSINESFQRAARLSYETTTIRAKWRLPLVGIALFLLISPGMASNLDALKAHIPLPPQQRTYFIYELQSPDLTVADASRVASAAGLVSVEQMPRKKRATASQAIGLFRDRSHITRMIFIARAGSLESLPDLAAQSTRAPRPPNAVAQARAWLSLSGLVKDQQPPWTGARVTTIFRQDFPREGRPQLSVPAVQTVALSREIGGLPVEGPDSVLSVEVAARGVVGFSCVLRPIRATSLQVTFKSPEAVAQEFMKAVSQVIPPGGKATVQSVRLIYYEQGKRYVQPAYEFLVSVIGSDEKVVGHRILIAADTRSPEPIPTLSGAASPLTGVLHGLATEPSRVRAAKSDPVINFGLYYDRLDYDGWAQDPWQFFIIAVDANTTLDALVPPAPTQYSLRLRHFQFNFPWMWQSGTNYQNFSPSFVEQVNFAMVSGHGSNFTMVTFQNFADTLQVGNFFPFGGNYGPTAYIVWRGCNFVPSPVDSTSAVTTWFNLFQGLRGTYGFRTEMAIGTLEGPDFGLGVGFGAPILSSWMNSVQNATSNSCAASEWDCPSAVIVTGHENDTIFDLAALQQPASLTAWWESPGSPSNSQSFPVP